MSKAPGTLGFRTSGCWLLGPAAGANPGALVSGCRQTSSLTQAQPITQTNAQKPSTMRPPENIIIMDQRLGSEAAAKRDPLLSAPTCRRFTRPFPQAWRLT
ncbi:hypothetical protein NHX12_030863 [Muraenolepis orangiensis]|uniref:Uncharacterized protein n=1 Tax=Muraenolepis orangiensis TaxID=630683 RepID=A0A9Q0EAP8_9TELE|nr:hypothetical protein NHX12_030863 [Muraenolepis orangiensis]